MLYQSEIDDAVLLGKSAAYHLAYEIALEVKYGGKMGCCICNLRLLRSWTNILACATINDTTKVISGVCLTMAQLEDIIEQITGMCKYATTSKS